MNTTSDWLKHTVVLLSNASKYRKNIEIRFRKGRKNCGQMRKCRLPAFPFTHNVFKNFYIIGSSNIGIIW